MPWPGSFRTVSAPGLSPVSQVAQLENVTVGMAFKADCDDNRSSLSYKFKKILKLKARDVLCTDPHVTTDSDLLPLDEVIEKSDLLVLCTPPSEYRDLDVRGKPVVDVWGFLNQAQS